MTILKEKLPVGLCSDHAGFELKGIIEGYLESKGISYKDFGTFSTESCDYPDFAHPCAAAVEAGEVYPAIAICGTELVALAREHNNANVLVLPGRFIEPEVALECVDVFFSTEFEGGSHELRIEKIPVKQC